MKKKIEMKVLALQIEWHWSVILLIRKRLNRLYEAGEPLSSQPFTDLDRRICTHSEKVACAQHKYKELINATSLLHFSESASMQAG